MHAYIYTFLVILISIDFADFRAHNKLSLYYSPKLFFHESATAVVVVAGMVFPTPLVIVYGLVWFICDFKI